MTSSPDPLDLESLARALCRLDCQDPDRPKDGLPIWQHYAQEASRAIDAIAIMHEQPDLFSEQKAA